MASDAGTSQPSAPAPARGSTQTVPDFLIPMARQGWIGIAAWMTFGLLIEGLLGWKTPGYLNDPQRRELFRLAHAHGTLLSGGLVVAAIWMQRAPTGWPWMIGAALRLGTFLMPIGFLLAGIWHFESDPGFAIWLVPLGALLVIFSAIALALGTHR